MEGVVENLMKWKNSIHQLHHHHHHHHLNQNPFMSLFQRKNSSNRTPQQPRQQQQESEEGGVSLLLVDDVESSPIPQLSPLANSVVARCSKILQIPTEQLQHRFDIALPGSVKQLFTYARNLLEFCSYQALSVVMTTRSPAHYLSDAEFRRLTYDMMLAWEAPCVDHLEIESPPSPSPPPPPPPQNVTETTTTGVNQEEEADEDGWSLFYSSSTNMAIQVDDSKTVGQEAFARIAPACAAVADVITVHNLFDALTSSSGRRLHFLIYDKYLCSLEKVFKSSKTTPGPFISNLQLEEGEIILDVDGAVPTQPVLQHIGIAAWPGRLTLTNYALYFEPLGVGLYDKAVRYDLATDMKQVVKPELTGPLGARLFDKAVMYKSTSVTEPVYFEFPEFKGNSRRDYWLDICLEILHAHSFIRKYNFGQVQQLEVLARATLGILRYHAIREAFHFFSSQYKTLLAFKLAESLPRGDNILATLSSHLALLSITASQQDVDGSLQLTNSPVALFTLVRLGFSLQKEINLDANVMMVGDLSAGETNPLEVVVKQSILDTGRAQAAQATVDKVKVEGIDTNVAVMKELLFPVIELVGHLQLLASWQDPLKSMVFLVLSCCAILRGWTRYMLPCMLAWCAALMLFQRHFNKKQPLEPFRVKAPPNKNAVEQLLTLQEAITQMEAVIQSGNVILLKIRALLFAILPQATERVALLLAFTAAVLAFVPMRHIILLLFVEAFTRDMPYRKESSVRWLRRLREWWIRIPAAPVQLVKLENNKKKK